MRVEGQRSLKPETRNLYYFHQVSGFRCQVSGLDSALRGGTEQIMDFLQEAPPKSAKGRISQFVG